MGQEVMAYQATISGLIEVKDRILYPAYPPCPYCNSKYAAYTSTLGDTWLYYCQDCGMVWDRSEYLGDS